MCKDRIELVHDLQEKNDQLFQMLEQEIEREKQLRRQQLELEEVTARYIDLYNLAPAGYCALSENGSSARMPFLGSLIRLKG